MEQLEKANYCLNQKREIIEKIIDNASIHRHFIAKREMRGLKRVLNEREALINKLGAINQELSLDRSWKGESRLAPLIKEIAQKEQKIIELSNQIIREAVAEKNCIAAELKQSKVHRQVRNQYVNPWASIVPGRRINERR